MTYLFWMSSLGRAHLWVIIKEIKYLYPLFKRRVWAKPEEDHYWNLGWHGCLVWWEEHIVVFTVCYREVLRGLFGHKCSLPCWDSLLDPESILRYFSHLNLFNAQVLETLKCGSCIQIHLKPKHKDDKGIENLMYCFTCRINICYQFVNMTLYDIKYINFSVIFRCASIACTDDRHWLTGSLIKTGDLQFACLTVLAPHLEYSVLWEYLSGQSSHWPQFKYKLHFA